ncbi:DUF1102 domain-containing protein [Halovivax limisalsi]|uniref:DUF1102 domain-containing protein n=1 Tax=Halovivax limisalsi TaxID=1453760 RepID=UPI001FFD9CF6|nr:DUF1102 domain-containing protein [Halovivax limisalsi]
MQRRKFIIGTGALATATAAAVGTGAFSSVTAARNIDVAVADDASAYLKLKGTDSHYVVDDGDGGTLAIDMSDSNPTNAGGTGVNPNAVTEFDDLFVVANHGTQPVSVGISKSGQHPDAVTFEDSNGNSLSNGIDLDVGEQASISVVVDTTAGSISVNEELLDSVVIQALA